MSKIEKETPLALKGTDYSFAIIASRYNQEWVDKLLKDCLQTLKSHDVSQENIKTVRVPGANEIPYAANIIAEDLEIDCLIALGIVIAGETNHHQIIGQSVSYGLQRASIDTSIPIINGVIVVSDESQAKTRCQGKDARGKTFAKAALEMAALHQDLVNDDDDDDDDDDDSFFS